MKYLMIALALAASLATADFAEARGRRGCSSCSAGGCPGGVCAVPYAPAKMATNEAPKPEAAVAAAAAPAPQTTAVASSRRFFRRR